MDPNHSLYHFVSNNPLIIIDPDIRLIGILLELFGALDAGRGIQVAGKGKKVIFMAGLLSLSEVHYHNGYKPLHPEVHGLSKFRSTSAISQEELALPIKLDVNLGYEETPLKEVAILLFLGVEFEGCANSHSAKVAAVI